MIPFDHDPRRRQFSCGLSVIEIRLGTLGFRSHGAARNGMRLAFGEGMNE